MGFFFINTKTDGHILTFAPEVLLFSHNSRITEGLGRMRAKPGEGSSSHGPVWQGPGGAWAEYTAVRQACGLLASPGPAVTHFSCLPQVPMPPDWAMDTLLSVPVPFLLRVLLWPGGPGAALGETDRHGQRDTLSMPYETPS